MPLPWFKCPRRYIDSPFFGDPKFDTLFLWLAANALQFEQTELICGREVSLRPGQIVIGRLNAATSLGLSEKVYRDRIKKLEKGQILDRDSATGKTRITIIDPDTYEWQKGIYSVKRASKTAKKGPDKGQARASHFGSFDPKTSPPTPRARAPARIVVKEVKDSFINSFCACAYGDGEDTELSDEESKRFEASFSPTKAFVLDVWRRERERYGLRYIKSPRNFRMADAVVVMIDDGEWSREDWETIVRNLMANAWAREHCGINAAYEDAERWLSAEKVDAHTKRDAGEGKGSGGSNGTRTGKFDHIDAINFG